MEIEKSVWNQKSVLITGHTSFKGAWLALILSELGARVHGISLPPENKFGIFNAARLNRSMASSKYCDINNYEDLSEAIKKMNPSFIFHLAAEPLVGRSYKNPVLAFDTNVMGTVNLLEICRSIDGLEGLLAITTDKVYENNEWVWPYRENDRLGGKDPYSASKVCSEIAISSYYSSFYSSQKIPLVSARAGNVVGGGDWSENRLIPDIIKAMQSQEPLNLRSPGSTRPWQHVLCPLEGYLLLAQKCCPSIFFQVHLTLGPIQMEMLL